MAEGCDEPINRRKGTLSLSWGPYGGFYLHPYRICLGWVAITLIPGIEIDDLMAAWGDRPRGIEPEGQRS